MSVRRVLERFVVAAVPSILAACGTLAPSTTFPVKPPSEYAAYQRNGAVVVGVEPLTTEEQVLHWFGSDLTRNGLIAVHVAIENGRESSGSVILLKDQFALGERLTTSRAGAEFNVPRRVQDLSARQREILDAERRAQAVVGFFVGGIIGAVAFRYGADDFTGQSVLQNRITQVALRTETLRPGDSVRGFVFFRVQPHWSNQSMLTFALNLRNTQTGENTLFLIDLPADKRTYMPN